MAIEHVDMRVVVRLNKDTAQMLMELLTKAAVTGPAAKHLADLYSQTEDAVAELSNE